MESQELQKLSKEELLSLVRELDDKLSRQNDLMNKVREHRHNYSEDFGLVVSAPVQALYEEVKSNPNTFNDVEKDKIIKTYIDSAEMHGMYDCIGLPIGTQLKRVKEVMVPKIREKAQFFSSLLGQSLIKCQDSQLIAILRMALNETESLCRNLGNIESFEYGIPEPFNLKAEVLDAFKEENSKTIKGIRSGIDIERYFGDLCDVQVDMNKQSFRSYVLRNIIKNLHDHAFKEIDNSDSAFDFVKKVRIKFVKDENNNHRMNLIIENNGKDFIGDRDAIFDKGVGSGEGIGLYSARQFLKHYGATINMLPEKVDDGYKVGFIINLPIL